MKLHVSACNGLLHRYIEESIYLCEVVLM